jgi:membrane protease YdiL (CAAX protease family)
VQHARARFAPFLAYVILFHLAWVVWPTVVYPRLQSFGPATLTYALLSMTTRLVVWVVPVFVYLRVVDRVEPFAYLKLTGSVQRGLLVGLALTALNFLLLFTRFGPPHPGMDRVTWNSVLGTSILIGFIEEVPYRGFMLQKFSERVGFWYATLITSVLFVLVHLPGWLALHTFRAETAVSIFIFGGVMAVALRYSKSLWAPIMAHSTNDCLTVIFFRL